MASPDQLVTIIIATKNQHKRLQTTLKYYARNRFRGQIIIADYSTTKRRKSSFKIYTKYKDALNLTFSHCDNVKHKGVVIQSVLEDISTPYVLGCDENDQVLIQGLAACVQFLEMNAAYVAASGTKCVVLDHDNREGIHYIPCLELETKYVKDRLTAYLRTRRSVLHYVHRTDLWKEMFKYADLTPNSWIGSEVLPCVISVMHGQIKDALQNSKFKAIFKREEIPVNHRLSDFTSDDYVKSMKVLRAIVLKKLTEGGMPRTEARKFFERELWLSILMLFMYKFTEHYPHLKEPLDAYAAILETYPFIWRRSQLTSSLTEEPDLLRLFKKEKQKHGRNNPFTSD